MWPWLANDLRFGDPAANMRGDRLGIEAGYESHVATPECPI